MVEVHQAVAVPGQDAHQGSIPVREHTLVSKAVGNLFVFADTQTKPLRQDVTAQVEQRFQTAPQTRLGRPDVPTIGQKSLAVIEGH